MKRPCLSEAVKIKSTRSTSTPIRNSPGSVFSCVAAGCGAGAETCGNIREVSSDFCEPGWLDLGAPESCCCAVAAGAGLGTLPDFGPAGGKVVSPLLSVAGAGEGSAGFSGALGGAPGNRGCTADGADGRS